MTNPNDLASEINNVLRGYVQDVAEEIETAKKTTAQDIVQELKTTSPKKTGAYRKGWTFKRTGSKHEATEYTVYNKPHYRLTHLLEHGHAKRGGGRVAAKVHIAPAEQKHIAEYLKKVRKAIE